MLDIKNYNRNRFFFIANITIKKSAEQKILAIIYADNVFLKLNDKTMGKLLHRSKAFSLVEIMIAVGVVGILAAVAIPMYQNYIIKAKIGKAISALSSYKGRINQHYLDYGEFPADNTSLYGFKTANPMPNVEMIKWKTNSGINRVEMWIDKLESDFNDVASSDPPGFNEGNKVWLEVEVNNDFLIWSCGTSSNNSHAIQCKYLPGSCNKNCI